jgi:signal peptidase
MSSIRGIVKDIIIVATCVAVIWIGLTAYFGAQNPFYVVSSGSMYPELAMHDIIVISGHALFEDVKIGDIIVFDRPKDHDKVIVHRVVAYVDDDPLTLRTKGDNNQNSIVGTDYPITEEEYKGTVIHVIPQVGYITKILQPPINYIIIAVIIGIMIIRQISKNKKALTEQMKTESEIKDNNESQPNEKMDGGSSWLDDYKNASKDFTTQEKKSTEKPEENTKSEGIPEFFLDREKESEEKK